jgi:large subunit ribosomal protein L15
MKYHELQVSATPSRRRVGRGIAAGQGKTAGRGTKGQRARTGNGRRPGFEGGQNPLMQRLPKLPGFKPFWAKSENVYTGQLNDLGATVDNFTLAEAGLVSSPYVKVKLIVKGELTKKVAVHVQAASETALAAVQKAGGSFKVTPQVKRLAKEKTEANK